MMKFRKVCCLIFLYAEPCVSAPSILSSIVNKGILKFMGSYDWKNSFSGVAGTVLLGHDGQQPITISSLSLPAVNLIISDNVTFRYAGTADPSSIIYTNKGIVQLTENYDWTDKLPSFITDSGFLEIGDGVSENSVSATVLPNFLTVNSKLTYAGTSTLNQTLIGGVGIYRHASNTSIDGISLPSASLEIGDGVMQTVATASKNIQKFDIKINKNATLKMSLNPDEFKTLHLNGRGLFTLSGGGTVTATRGSPDVDIVRGTFNIDADYGLGDAVNVSINRDGIVNVNSGALLNAQSLTYYLGDGNTAVSSADLLRTGTLNFQTGAKNSTLPAIITVQKDMTVSDNDIIEKLYTLEPGSTVNTLIKGVNKVNNGSYSPVLVPFPTDGLFEFGLKNTDSNLNMIVKKNNTSEFISIVNETGINAAETLVKGAVGGMTTVDLQPLDPQGFYAKSFTLLNQVQLFVESIKSNSINTVHLSNIKQKRGMQAAHDTEPLVISLKDSSYAFFLAPIYGQEKKCTTEFEAGSTSHQLGLLAGIERRNADETQFLSVQVAVLAGHSLVNSTSKSSSFSKTGVVGVFFSQAFYKEAEWNTFANASFTYALAKRFTANEVFQSRPKSKRFNISSELAYKFKYYGQNREKSMLSFRPLVGVQYSHIDFSAHTEKRTVGSGMGLTTLADQYNLLDAYTNFGVRQRFLWNDDVSFKLTGIAEYHRNIHCPSSIVKKIMLTTSAKPLIFKTNDYAKNKYTGSLTGSLSQKNNNWKLFLKVSFTKTSTSKTYQVMLTINRKL